MTTTTETTYNPAPWPTTPEQVTADALIRHYAAQGTRDAAARAYERQHGTIGSDRWYAHFLGEQLAHHTVHLLATLRDHSVEAADSAARELWLSTEPNETDEHIWAAASALGLDPQRIWDGQTAALKAASDA